MYLIYMRCVLPEAFRSFSGVKTSEVCKEMTRSRPVGHLEGPPVSVDEDLCCVTPICFFTSASAN